jgi:hypothetical protein
VAHDGAAERWNPGLALAFGARLLDPSPLIRQALNELSPFASHARTRHDQIETGPLRALAGSGIDVRIEAESGRRAPKPAIRRQRFHERRTVQIGVRKVHDKHRGRPTIRLPTVPIRTGALHESRAQQALGPDQLNLEASRRKSTLHARAEQQVWDQSQYPGHKRSLAREARRGRQPCGARSHILS